jgi:hypothetical protein
MGIRGLMQKSNQAKHVIHDYLKYTPASGYMECSLCKNRTHSICIKCRSCYTCHCELLSEQKQQKKEWQRKVIDVYGQQIEPICNHRRCNHKFSLHGYYTHKCKCRHAINYAAGISLKIEA